MSFFQSLYHNFFVVFSDAGATASIPHAIVFVTVFVRRLCLHLSKNPAKNNYLRSTPHGVANVLITIRIFFYPRSTPTGLRMS